MARALRHPATIMLLVGLAVLGLALCCLGGSVVFTALAEDGSPDQPPAAAIVCVIVGAVAFVVGVIGVCLAALASRPVARPHRTASDVGGRRGMSEPTA
ncbi:hypothetical protein [Microbacterium sp. GXS0129]|uniref:hypothetical protein n=1 Tax=Microbacterium sp. GXS0129 TaxID=3377836 RepID=UPI00383AFF8F